MLSRTADHLFWMSRYTERAENAAEGGVSLQHSPVSYTHLTLPTNREV